MEAETLNVNTVSFAQIFNECEGIKEKIAEKILKIVETRGKLHNPITGTGGMLIGRVKKIGKHYDNNYNIAVGDRIATLSSLSLTPLKIYEILNISPEIAQVEVRAEAIYVSKRTNGKSAGRLPFMAYNNRTGRGRRADTDLEFGKSGRYGIGYGSRRQAWPFMRLRRAAESWECDGKLIGLVRHQKSCTRC